MSKIEKYNMTMYPSIKCALQEMIAPYKEEHPALGYAYTDEAYEQVAAFLCVNNIDHTFIINQPHERFGVRLVSVCWKGAMGEENLGWWEAVEEEHYLVKFEENWADEMDISAFAVFSAKDYRNWRSVMGRLEKAMEHAVLTYTFGTNEEQEYEDFKEFVECFDVKPITKEQANTIREVFGIDTYYGGFPGIDTLNYYLEDMEADE